MSQIQFRMISKSLEDNPEWIKLSLKRRALYLFIVSKCVYTESYQLQDLILTYGQYVKSFSDIAIGFNETVSEHEDKIDKNFVQKALKRFVEINLIKYEIIGSGIRSKTIITITHSDTYELIKNMVRYEKSGVRYDRDTIGNILEIRSDYEKNTSHNISTTINKQNEKYGGDTLNNNCKLDVRYEQQRNTLTTPNLSVSTDNVQTLPPNMENESASEVDVSAARKYKLSPPQVDSYIWLKRQKINSSDQTLCWWAREYSLKRLKEVYLYSISLSKTNVGGYMQKILKEEVYLAVDHVTSNKEFTLAYKEQNEWHELDLYDTHVEWCHGKSVHNVSMKLSPNAYVEGLLHLFNKFNEIKKTRVYA